MSQPLPRDVREPARRVALMAAYVLLVESVFSALAALAVAAELERGFGSTGGLLAAIRTPGAPLLVEGLLPFVFRAFSTWAPKLLALGLLHALVAPLVQMIWLAGLGPEGPAHALRGGLRLFLPALRLRLLLLAPLLFWAGTVALVLIYAQLVWGGTNERTADVACVVALSVGAALLGPLRVLCDLAHASLAHAESQGAEPSARAGVATALREFSLGHLLRWALSAAAGLFALGLGALGSTHPSVWLSVFAVQLAAYARYVARGAWLSAALASLARRRLGNVTQNSAPPSVSSTFAAEMRPP